VFGLLSRQMRSETTRGGTPGLAYVSVASGAFVQLTAVTNVRKAVIYATSLYYSTSSSPVGIFLVGTAGTLPTTASQTTTQMLTSGSYAFASPYGFVFESPAQMWVCDASGSGGGLWRLQGPPFRAPGATAADNPSATPCTDVTGQLEAGLGFVVYWISGSGTALQSVLNRVVSGSGTPATLVTSVAALGGIALVPSLGTPTQTQSLSPSQTQTLTLSQAPSPSQTTTPSQTPSPTQTATVSQTTSPTQIATLSQAPSPTQTSSSTLTMSPSQRVTSSSSPSVSQVATLSQTQSASPTQTASQTQSPSWTVTSGLSPPQSATLTGTPSSLTTLSGTPTFSPSVTASQSSSPQGTPS
jgi:hypothetical protein